MRITNPKPNAEILLHCEPGNRRLTDVVAAGSAALRLAEMRRVVRSGGTVTAVVWDTFSGLTHWRMMWDIAVTLDPYLVPHCFHQ